MKNRLTLATGMAMLGAAPTRNPMNQVAAGLESAHIIVG